MAEWFSTIPFRAFGASYTPQIAEDCDKYPAWLHCSVSSLPAHVHEIGRAHV